MEILGLSFRPAGYIGCRNRFHGIGSWPPLKFKNTASVAVPDTRGGHVLELEADAARGEIPSCLHHVPVQVIRLLDIIPP